jgi:subfamily B ATP-binding cassette protein HlyB/CyaB
MFNATRAALPPIKGDITFDNISFRYRIDAPLALQDISLKVPARA